MTQYEKDLERTINFNGRQMPIAYYNLVLSIRDVSLWTKGMKPHRNWKLKQVKEYFGITGNADKILDRLKAEQQCWTKN